MKRCGKSEAQRPVQSTMESQETYQPIQKEISMQWTKPEFTDLRFGFEITMYIANR